MAKNLINLENITWFNPLATTRKTGLSYVVLSPKDVAGAEARLQRFAPYLCQAFPETQQNLILLPCTEKAQIALFLYVLTRSKKDDIALANLTHYHKHPLD